MSAFDEYGAFSNYTAVTKTMRVFRNGDHTISFELALKSDFDQREVAALIESKLKFKNVHKLRLFTSEGLEITLNDLSCIKKGESVYASRGENFDRASSLSEYDMAKQLGEGGFGQVFLAVNKRTQEKVAIKYLKSSGADDEIERQSTEAETLKSLNHRGVVKIINCVSLSGSQLALVMEYLDGGELLEYVSKRGKLTEDEARELFVQIAEAVAYCHKNKLVHCDLKLENILLESKTSKIVKIIDFGISGLNTDKGTEADGGSLDYMAPEFFSGSKTVHPGVDVWALGCMLFGMINGRLPFGDISESKIKERIMSARFEHEDGGKDLSKEVKHLISRMLEVNHELRINAFELLNHPWMTGEKLRPSDVLPEKVRVIPEIEKEKVKPEESKIEVERKSDPPTKHLAAPKIAPITRQAHSFKHATPAISSRTKSPFIVERKEVRANSDKKPTVTMGGAAPTSTFSSRLEPPKPARR